MRRDILCIMQNQWLKNPERHRRSIDRFGEEYRRRALRYALFAGCKTGRVLQTVFGDLIERMEFEEASREIASKASGSFPADLDHIRRAIDHYNPSFILTFGKTASEAIRLIDPDEPTLHLPHPCARAEDTGSRLRAGATFIRTFLSSFKAPVHQEK